MSLTVTVTATHRSGNFVRVFAALRRLGLQPRGGTINNSADPRMDLIQINLPTVRRVESSTLSKLKNLVPTIVDVQVDQPPATQTAAPAVAPANNVVRHRSADSNTLTQLSENAPNQTSSLPKFDDERLDFETKRLAGAYPDEIYTALKYLDTTINPAQRQFALTQLGNRIGMYAARKRKRREKDSGINKTVRSSLSMQKAQFGKVSPVIAAIMEKKVAKRSTSTESKSKTLVSELSSFLTVSMSGDEVHVAECPHCNSSHSSPAPDCYFISAFIESFIKDMWDESKHKVTQTKSKATGASNCVFVVSGIRLR